MYTFGCAKITCIKIYYFDYSSFSFIETRPAVTLESIYFFILWDSGKLSLGEKSEQKC